MRDNIIASVKKSIKNYGHLYVLAIISAFTLATRLQGLNNLTNESGEIILLGNDPWYHFRAIMFQIENYPYFLKFDPLSGYPEGAAAGTFGTLFDFVHATAALIIGLGNPSEELVKEILILTPPIFGVISVLSVYLLAKYMTGSKWGGVSASLILSLIPGTFYRRTRVGFGDHQAMEVFMLLLTVFAIVKFIDYAEDNHIILELIKDYSNTETKEWAKYGIGAVVTLYLYYLVWPPAMMIFGLIAITATIYVIIGYDRDIITEYGLLSMAIMSVINLLMVLVRLPTMEMQVAKPSIIHIGVAVISIFLTGTAYLLYKKGTEENWDNRKFYGLYASILIIPSIIAFIVEPSIINGILNQVYRVLGYPFGLGSGGSQVQTIGEERGASILGLTVQQYGFMLLSSIAGIAYTVFDINKDISNKNKFGSKLFLVVFALFITVISIRTVRFNYYLAPVVSIFASVIIYQLIRFVDIPKKVKDIQGYHILSIIIIVFLFTPVLLVPVQVGTVYQQQSNMNQGYQDWQEPLDWLDENSEDVGIDTYEKASKSTYEYPDESYGVMSWWDYGHWITVTSDRPPVANPFQQHAYNASDFLLADSPDKAESVMENLDEDSEARYVAIDWQMVSPYSKYGAIVQFNDKVNLTDTITRYYETRPGEGASLSFIQKDQRYYESMMARLYYGHGSRMSASQYTIDYNAQGAGQGQTLRTVTPELEPITKHNNSIEAKEYADNNTEVSVGGIGNQPPEAVESLDHYRLVKTSSSLSVRKGTVVREYRNLNSTSDSEIGVRDYDSVPSTVKLFEKVDGSDIEITNLQPNTSISIGVPVNDPATNQTFVYSKRIPVDSNGVADFVVPYSTTGYDNVSNAPAVRGIQSYQVSYTGSNQLIAQFAVPEETVQSDTDPIRLSI